MTSRTPRNAKRVIYLFANGDGLIERLRWRHAASHPEVRTADRRDSLRRSKHFNPRRGLTAEEV
jgi:hypothetical protein